MNLPMIRPRGPVSAVAACSLALVVLSTVAAVITLMLAVAIVCIVPFIIRCMVRAILKAIDEFEDAIAESNS